MFFPGVLKMSQYLLSYDISCPRRWRRLYRGFKAQALPVQYSVFLADLTPARLAAVVALIEAVICPQEDDVRIYPLPDHGWQRRIGGSLLPDGIGLTGLPLAFCAAPMAASQKTPAAPAHSPAGVRPATKRTRASAAVQARVQTGQRRGITLL